MARGRRELVLGAKIDPVFGPVVMIGDGGRYVEALDDIALLLPPFSAEQVREALSTLRLRVFLEGRRGDPPMDVEPLCRAAVRLGDVIVGAGQSIASIDLNPVMVGAEGEGVVVVDALVERAPAHSGCTRAPPVPPAESSDTRCRPSDNAGARPSGDAVGGVVLRTARRRASPALARPARAASGRGDAGGVAAAGHLRRRPSSA